MVDSQDVTVLLESICLEPLAVPFDRRYFRFVLEAKGINIYDHCNPKDVVYLYGLAYSWFKVNNQRPYRLSVPPRDPLNFGRPISWEDLVYLERCIGSIIAEEFRKEKNPQDRKSLDYWWSRIREEFSIH